MLPSCFSPPSGRWEVAARCSGLDEGGVAESLCGHEGLGKMTHHHVIVSQVNEFLVFAYNYMIHS